MFTYFVCTYVCIPSSAGNPVPIGIPAESGRNVQPRFVKNLVTCIQTVGCNCGPIACVKVMEIFGFLKDGYIERLGKSMNKCRQTVMNYFNQCITKYNKQLRVEI